MQKKKYNTEEDKIAKTTTRKKAQQELFQSDRVTQFIIVAGLKYKTYSFPAILIFSNFSE